MKTQHIVVCSQIALTVHKTVVKNSAKFAVGRLCGLAQPSAFRRDATFGACWLGGSNPAAEILARAAGPLFSCVGQPLMIALALQGGLGEGQSQLQDLPVR